MAVFRAFWIIVSIILFLSLIAKLVLAAILGNLLDVFPSVIGLLICFYLLFELEGLQVAGLQVKDLDEDGIARQLKEQSTGNPGKVIPMYKIFDDNFDGFVTGRQVFVIMTVVTLAFLIKGVNVPVEHTSDLLGDGLGPKVIGFLNRPELAYITPILIPAWVSQLLPQFMADGRPLHFMSIPGSKTVLAIAMLLDKIELGQPAHQIVELLSRLKLIGKRTQITIGKRTHYKASLDFYGRAKSNHKILFALGTPSIVSERIAYVFKRGRTENIDHVIQLAAPVKGDIKIQTNLPPNVFGQIEAQTSQLKDIYAYRIRIRLNQSLPRENVDIDEAIVEIQYETDAYTDESGKVQTLEFTSMLPTENAIISIRSDRWLLRKPSVSIVEKFNGRIKKVAQDTTGQDWEIITTPEPTNNLANIFFAYPTVTTVYQVEFETMNVEVGKHAKNSAVVDK